MKMLDFNAIQQPTWALRLRDDAQTVVHIAVPTVDLVERMLALSSELSEITTNKDARAIKALYTLIADVINNNDDGYTFTAEDLRDTYKMSLLDTAYFVAGFLDFVAEIKDAKN